MGKKSKRREAQRSQTKQNQRGNRNDEFQRIVRAVNSLVDKSNALFQNDLRSQAQAELSKIISLLETNKEMLIKKDVDFYRSTNVHAYEKIADLEVRGRNFQAVIPIHDFCNSISIMTERLYVLYCLALMMTGKKNSYEASEAALKYVHFSFSVWQSDPSKPCMHPDKSHLASDSFRPVGPSKHLDLISIRVHLASLGSYWHMFLVELRRMRKWDEALDFTNKFGSYIEESIEESNFFALEFMYVATYIERYRVEARKIPRKERNKMSVLSIAWYKNIFARIGGGLAKICKRKALLLHPYIKLLCAQWIYLSHQGTIEQTIKERDTAVRLVEEYIESQYKGNLCVGCEQQSTPSNPLFVCSGCRVACFCCIDHQRSSWKKEFHWGVGIGHKILCPLYKTYHKYKNAEKSHSKNIDEYQSRFRRECEKFLSDSLGLKDLCFSRDFVDKNGEEFRFENWRKALRIGRKGLRRPSDF